MENLGGWDQPADHPDFDPNLLVNVDSWAVDPADHVNVNANDHQHQYHNNNENRKFNVRSHYNQWTNLSVVDFGEDNNTHNVEKSTTDNSNKTSSLQHHHQHHHQQQQGSCSPHLDVAISTEVVEAAVEAAVAAISETSESVTSGDRSIANGTVTTTGSSISSSSRGRITHHQPHPLGISSSASCPEQNFKVGNDSFATQQYQQYSTMPITFPQQQQHHLHEHHGLCSVDLSQALERSVAAPSTNALDHTTSSSNANQHMSSLAANFMLAQSIDPSVVEAGASASDGGPISLSNNNLKTNVTSRSSSSKKTKSTKKGRAPRQAKATSSTKRKKKTNASRGDGGTASSSTSLPPFYLFDAPVELRANFMQNQRRLGLPIQNDPNSYHYGETVNGFHPHQYQLPLGATASTTISATTSTNELSQQPLLGETTADASLTTARPDGHPKNVPQLIDARHGNSNRKNKGGQVKNEREQKRAQKITELIEQLRLQMEDGGWQVEARSKFHTLSNCAEYVKHMIASASEKEKENEKLQSDLDAKRLEIRKKEEKAMHESRSDPESVTSSLTSGTTFSSSRHKEAETESERNNSDGDNDDDNNDNNSSNKRKLSGSNQEGSSRDENNKKLCTVSSEATTEDSSGDHRGSSGSGSGGSGDGPSAHGYSMSKTISTVSDVTDSNRGSSSNNCGSGEGSSDDVPTEQESQCGNEDNADQPSNSSISSDAAVANEKTSRDRHSCHKDVVFNNDKRMSRKRPPEEVTSLERSFELNYEEVFNKSNIPQLIASTSGKIVTWNKCFAKATGYRRSEIERMTIFSLVRPEKLVNFFEIVAAALKPPDEDTEKGKENNCEETTEEMKMNSSEKDNVSTQITLPPDFATAEATVVDDCDEIEQNIEVEEPHLKEVDGVTLNEEDGDSRKTRSEKSDVNSTSISNEGSSATDKSNGEKKIDTFNKDIEKEINEATPRRLLDYTAMTLPCIDFPAMKKRNQAAVDSDLDAIPPLHVTITLMADTDPRKRCFHCVFTNSKGTKGSLGIITPDLLASLFTKPSRRRKKSHGHQRKHARSSNENHSVKQISNEDQPVKPPSPLLMPPPHAYADYEEQMQIEAEAEEFMKAEVSLEVDA